MDFVVSFGKTCHIEEEKDLCQKAHYALLYEAWMGKSLLLRMGNRPQACCIANQCIMSASKVGTGLSTIDNSSDARKPEYSKPGRMACSDKIKSMANEADKEDRCQNMTLNPSMPQCRFVVRSRLDQIS